MPSDTHKIVIHADKTPAEKHVRRSNAPTIDDVAIVIVGDQFQPRDIVLHPRNDYLTKVAETHWCYDALQYPIFFWDGADGYHFNIKMIDQVSGKEINKKYSAVLFIPINNSREWRQSHFEMPSIVPPTHRRYVCKNQNRTFDIHPFESDEASLWRISSFARCSCKLR